MAREPEPAPPGGRGRSDGAALRWRARRRGNGAGAHLCQATHGGLGAGPQLCQATHGGLRPRGPVTVVGWGSLNVFNPREAYRFVADFSIYVERAWRGRGVGHAMLEALIELARTHGFHKLVLSAFPFNAVGGALYEKLGFRTVGVYREQGLLDGKWVDTIIMEKLL